MLGRDPYMPLNQLLEQVKRYLGTDQGIPRSGSTAKLAADDYNTDQIRLR